MPVIDYGEQFSRLKKYIQSVDIALVNCPVGITIPGSGDKYYVRYSRSEPQAFATIFEAMNHIKRFLDSAYKAQKTAKQFTNYFVLVKDLRDNQKKSFREIGKELEIPEAVASQYYNDIRFYGKDKIHHWIFDLPSRVRNPLFRTFEGSDFLSVTKDDVRRLISEDKLRCPNLGEKGMALLKEYLKI